MEKGIQPLPDTLPASDSLSAFSEEDRRVLAGYGCFAAYRVGSAIIREKERQDALYFLIDGELQVVHNVKGGTTPLGTIKSGEWFGEINIFDPKSASAQVVARSNSQVWHITRPKLEEFLNEKPQLGCMLLLGAGEALARRARDMVAKLNATWELSW